MKTHERVETRRSTALILMIGSVALGALILELGLRVWLESSATEAQVALYGTVDQVLALRTRYERHHYLPFIPAPDYVRGRNRHNALGFRGDEIATPKPEGVFRIALIGGSTTYTTGIGSYRKSYPYLLQSNLRQSDHSTIEVVNAGVARYSTWESLLNLILRVLEVEPDMVIAYHGINDVHTRLVHPFSAYRSDNSGSRVAYSRPSEAGWMQSALVRWVATRLGVRKPLAGLVYTRTHDWLPTNFTRPFRRQKLSGSYPADLFTEVSAAEMLARNQPIYFQRNLENMIAICQFHDIEIVLMTFASSAEFSDPMVSSPEYQGAFAEQNASMLRLCEERDVPCYDFATEMPADKVYWKDGRHVTEAGAKLKAELVTAYLRRSGLKLTSGVEPAKD